MWTGQSAEERLEGVPPRAGAQIDVGQVVGLPTLGGLPLLAPLGEGRDPARGKSLRIARERRRHIAIHPLQDVQPCLGVVPRPHDAIDGVAAHAGVEHRLLLVCPGDALEPFGVGQVRFDILGRAKGQIEGRRS